MTKSATRRVMPMPAIRLTPAPPPSPKGWAWGKEHIKARDQNTTFVRSKKR